MYQFKWVFFHMKLEIKVVVLINFGMGGGGDFQDIMTYLRRLKLGIGSQRRS